MAKEPRVVAKLRNWRKHVCDKNGTFVFWGHVYDDLTNRFPNGHFIHTARVEKVEGDLVYTANSIYKLDGDEVGPSIEYT